MGLIYIKFKTGDVVKDFGQRGANWRTRSVENTVVKVLSAVLPNANPDFDRKIQDVAQWILEVDDEKGIPEREIGLDDNGNVMMIMPWMNNLGFWTDNNVRLDELAKSCDMQFVAREEFVTLWNNFENRKGTR